MQDSIGYGGNSCQAPCAPCADGVVTQDAIMSEYPQGVPVQESMPSDAMPLDQVSPIETESAEPGSRLPIPTVRLTTLATQAKLAPFYRTQRSSR